MKYLKICHYCGDEFSAIRSDSRFCKKSCSNQFISPRKESYEKYNYMLKKAMGDEALKFLPSCSIVPALDMQNTNSNKDTYLPNTAYNKDSSPVKIFFLQSSVHKNVNKQMGIWIKDLQFAEDKKRIHNSTIWYMLYDIKYLWILEKQTIESYPFSDMIEKRLIPLLEALIIENKDSHEMYFPFVLNEEFKKELSYIWIQI